MIYKDTLRLGDMVVPSQNKENPLFCGSGMYNYAVVGSQDPLKFVSSEGDMVWEASVDSILENCEVFGMATPEVLKNVFGRIARDEYKKEIQEMIKAL